MSNIDSERVCEIVLPTGETLEVWRLPHGGIVGVDASFLDTVEDTIQDPYNSAQDAVDPEDVQYRLLDEVDNKFLIFDLTHIKPVV